MRLEPATAAHVEAMTALARRREPRLLPGPGAVRLFDDDRFTVHAAVRAVEGERLLGFAALVERDGLPPGHRMARLYVDRGAEDRGVGSALAAGLRGSIDPGATVVRTRVCDDDPRSLAVARHWGLEVEQHSLVSSTPLADQPEVTAPPGVRLEACPGLTPRDQRAVEAMLLASQTNPEAQRGLRFTLGGLRRVAGADEVPVAVLARVDGRPAALCVGAVAGDVLRISWTGVGPIYRGRGLGRLVKQEAHRLAAAAGATRAVTENEEHNTGIRRVNASLGYRVEHGLLWLAAPVPRG
jgi:GNAT superfamily N-acetyltransferase